jgi:hypothetical protein
MFDLNVYGRTPVVEAWVASSRLPPAHGWRWWTGTAARSPERQPRRSRSDACADGVVRAPGAAVADRAKGAKLTYVP